MNKKVELNSYARTDENHGDYMVYEIKYANGYKEYVSRDVFRSLKVLEIIKAKEIDMSLLYESFAFEKKNKTLHGVIYYNANINCFGRQLTQEEYELLKELK